MKEISLSETLESLKQNFITDFDSMKQRRSNSNNENISDLNNYSENTIDKQIQNTQLEIKPENLNYAKISILLSNFFFSLSGISIKLLNNYKSNYNYNLFSAIRFFIIFTLSYRVLVYRGIKIESVYKVNNWKWFFIRTSSNFFSLLFFTLSLRHVRMSTTACVFMVYPIFTNILSTFILSEKFSLKYLISCLVCFLGCVTFTFSERNSNSHTNLNDQSEFDIKIFLGILYAALDGFFSSILSISSKFLMKEMNSYESSMYIGFYLSFVSLFLSLFDFKCFMDDLVDLLFVIQSAINGFVVYGAFHFLNEGVENADLSKTSYIWYTQVIFNVIFGLIFFGEVFYFTDLLGFVMIIGTNVCLTFYSKSD